MRIRQRTNTQSHRFFTISFILLPYTIVSFGGLPNNKSKWERLIIQGCQKIRTNLNRNLIREIVRRFFHCYLISQKFHWYPKKLNKKFIVKFFNAVGQSFLFTKYSRRVIHSGRPPMSIIQVFGGEWTKLRAWHTSCWFGFNQEGAITNILDE